MDNTEELCKKGDKLYRLSKNGITEVTVIEIEHYPHCVYKLSGCSDSYFNRAFGKTLFKTYAEANDMIGLRTNILEKRRLLKAYEEKLNKKFGIKDHYIIK